MKTKKLLPADSRTAPTKTAVFLAALITTLLSMGTSLMFGTAFDIECNTFAVFAYSVIPAALFALVHSFGKKAVSIPILIAVPIGALLLVANDFMDSQSGLGGFLLALQNGEFPLITQNLNMYRRETASIFLFIGIYNLISSSVCTYILLRRRLVPASLVFYLPLIYFCLFNIVRLPGTVPCLITFSGVILVLFVNAFRKKNRRTSDRMLLVMLATTSVLAVALGLVFPQKDYDKDEVATGILLSIEEDYEDLAKEEIVQEIINKYFSKMKVFNVRSDIPGTQQLQSSRKNLNNVGPFNPSDDLVMTIRKDRNNSYKGPDVNDFSPLYLKIESSDTYKKNVLSSSKIKMDVYRDDFDPEKVTAPYTISIHPAIDSSVDVTPYYTDFYGTQNVDYTTVNAYNTTKTKKFTYAYSPIPVKSGNVYTDEYLLDYVYGTALEVPEETARAIIEDCTLPVWYTDALYGNSTMSDAEKVRRVTEMVRYLHPYDRNSAYPPKGADFVPWFINDAESGICVHYAITSVILLRMLGIPARYVTGYIDSASFPNHEKNIYAAEAHAWFEFFVPEYGWIMGDATPGYGPTEAYCNINAVAKVYPEIETANFSYSKFSLDDLPDRTYWDTPDTPSPTPSPSPSPDETEPAASDDATPTPTTATEPSETQQDTPDNTPADTPAVQEDAAVTPTPADPYQQYLEEKEAEARSRYFKVINILVLILIVAVSIFLLICIARLAFVIYWNSELTKKGNNNKAIARYHYYEMKGRVLSVSLPGKADRIAQKAAFSNDEITDGELMEMIASCEKRMYDSYTGFGKFKRLLYKLMEVRKL